MIQAIQERKDVILGLGQMAAAKGDDTVLVCLGLGSCVAVCAYDPLTKVGGMAHVVLPSSYEARVNGLAPQPKYMDCAVPMLVEALEKEGALKTRLVVKIAGGAQMVVASGPTSILNIGDRNAQAAKDVLAQHNLPIEASETGGHHGRTARLYLDTGKFVVSIAGGASNEL